MPDEPNPSPGGVPSFILCMPRSGSTLLRWILDTHPAVACPAETYVGDLLDRLLPFLTATVGAASKFEGPKKKPVILEARRFVAAAFGAYARERGKRVWVDKSPTSTVLHAALVREVFPLARFFCLYRSCLDVVQSCIELSTYGFRLPGMAAYVADSPENVVEAATKFWCDVTEKELAFEEQHPDVCLRVRYEDLAREPRAWAPKLFTHLGLDCPADLLARVFHEHHGEGAGDPRIHFTSKIEEGAGRGGLVPFARLTAPTRARADALTARLGYASLLSPLPADVATPDRTRAHDLFDRVIPARLDRPEIGSAGAAVAFVVDDGVTAARWVVDVTGPAARVARDADVKVDAALETTPAVLLAFERGELNPVVAQQDGRLRISGDRETAFKFFRLIFMLAR